MTTNQVASAAYICSLEASYEENRLDDLSFSDAEVALALEAVAALRDKKATERHAQNKPVLSIHAGELSEGDLSGLDGELLRLGFLLAKLQSHIRLRTP